jgi:hypothetical protein
MCKIIMFNKKRLIIAVVLVVATVAIFATVAYILFLRPSSETEVVYAATEVGTPNGPAVTKSIGPAGGSLASPDGRLTVTVPQNALTETVAFSIQPITNKAGNGLGLAYRLEPNGKTFTTPLEISVRYDEKDLEGTIPEALSLAYQDKQGAWHAQKSAKLDQSAKTLTVATTHFTDEAFLARLRIYPSEKTLYVGQDVKIQLIECPDPGFWDKLFSRPCKCSEAKKGEEAWKLRGPGRIYGWSPGEMYEAPLKKPKPNIAWVDLTVNFQFWKPITGETSTAEKIFSAKITIINRGYTATGKTADIVWSGEICSLDKPFTVSGSVINYKINFVPSSPTAGTATIAGAGLGVKAESVGTCTYKIEGADTDKPRIALTQSTVGHTRVGDFTGGGTIYIDLVPLDTECK